MAAKDSTLQVTNVGPACPVPRENLVSIVVAVLREADQDSACRCVHCLYLEMLSSFFPSESRVVLVAVPNHSG